MMATLKAATCSLIQINVLEGFLDKVKSSRKMELPDDKGARVKITMTPNPKVECLHKEKDNSPTRLLAATFAYKILCKFVNGTMQWEMQKQYNVKAKQLTTCITGHEYLGGSN